ncbi:MAG: glutamine--tRNA ligase/YqeY domain fusion protein [Myxococcales bacterium]|nr:glutamine--tRNA ligase/YqeY domain fusion protein [Myxococcota bacterium]MDW8281580.1 glutamine--tRNA ligase/YqeY domain fusion protein [Myxococcales bacterium]
MSESSSNFIHDIIEADFAAGRRRLVTRFPPEPNGYLHIGHAKSICLNFGLAEKYGGQCNLRFDDTNPCTEEEEYVTAIQRDVRWLGFDWQDRLCFASDYFERLYEWAEQLIRAGKAYVCDLSPDEMADYRGNYYRKGRPSPFRDRSVEENLDLFRRMRAGEFPDGSKTLRAKIDMSSQNMNLRDPPMYRIRHVPHHRTGHAWCIYPTYDWAHGQCDAIEGVTHSICTLEFENHRPLYDWFLRELGIADPPRQIEFARLNLSYTVLSKRKLIQLVQQGHVNGWDDPRMPTLAGLRRRGYTPESIRAFCERIGVSRADSLVDVGLLENAVRDDLNRRAPRVMGVLHPLRVVLTNFPPGQTIELEAPLHPEDPSFGTRTLRLSRELYIERDDFRENPPNKWFRLAPGREVRLRYACLITCQEVVRDPHTGEIVELRCTWDPASRGGQAPDGRRVQGTSHWVSAEDSVPAEVRLYDRLFTCEDPGAQEDFLAYLNPASLTVLSGCRVEPMLAQASPGASFQFERLGYFCVDPDTRPGHLVFNRTVTLKDSWAKIEKKEQASRLASAGGPGTPRG